MGKRGRAGHTPVKDKYPERIRNVITPAVPGTLTANQSSRGTFTALTWTLPVEINLDHPVYIELEKLQVFQSPLTFAVDGVSTATAGSTVLTRWWDIWFMKEQRTVAPSNDDNAIIDHFMLEQEYTWGDTSAGGASMIMPKAGMPQSVIHDYQDQTTGNGLLLTQPRIYVYGRDTITVGTEAVLASSHNIGLMMQFRLVTDVTAREFLTEVVGAYS